MSRCVTHFGGWIKKKNNQRGTQTGEGRVRGGAGDGVSESEVGVGAGLVPECKD